MTFDIAEFGKIYKGSKWFVDTENFNEFIKDLKNPILMINIKFCNDYLQIPPVLAYVRYRNDIYCKEMDKKEKIAIGACFGYLYQFGEYKDEYSDKKSVWVNDATTKIKTASYFIKK